MTQTIYQALEAVCHTDYHVSLSTYTTFRIGGNAKAFTQPNNIRELQAVLSVCREHRLPYFILGAGSNLLIADEGLDAAVISTAGLSDIVIDGNTVTAGAGVPLSILCKKAAAAGLSGLEFAYGIPGSVGGGVYMNAGAYGGELKDVITEVTYLDQKGTLCSRQNADCGFSYRCSTFQSEDCVILSASFTLAPGDPAQIMASMQEIIAKRKEKQPLEYPSAGSAFKRPEGAFAAALIDQCGLKGFSVGGAMVSEKHAGFIINADRASCSDTCKLFMEVRRIVVEKTGYLLEPEVKLLGRDWE